MIYGLMGWSVEVFHGMHPVNTLFLPINHPINTNMTITDGIIMLGKLDP